MSRPNTSARMLLWVLGAPLLAVMCGCGQAVRFLRETPDGGTVTIPTNTNQWPTYYRSQAAYLMQKKCPTGYEIDREAAVGGPRADAKNHAAFESYFGYTGGSEAEQEYHITFHRVTSPTAAPAKPVKGNSSTRPPAPPVEEGKEELPPPRPLSLPNE